MGTDLENLKVVRFLDPVLVPHRKGMRFTPPKTQERNEDGKVRKKNRRRNAEKVKPK